MKIINFETYKKESDCEGCLTPNECAVCYLDHFKNTSINDQEVYDYFVDNYRTIRKEIYG